MQYRQYRQSFYITTPLCYYPTVPFHSTPFIPFISLLVLSFLSSMDLFLISPTFSTLSKPPTYLPVSPSSSTSFRPPLLKKDNFLWTNSVTWAFGISQRPIIRYWIWICGLLLRHMKLWKDYRERSWRMREQRWFCLCFSLIERRCCYDVILYDRACYCRWWFLFFYIYFNIYFDLFLFPFLIHF